MTARLTLAAMAGLIAATALTLTERTASLRACAEVCLMEMEMEMER